MTRSDIRNDLDQVLAVSVARRVVDHYAGQVADAARAGAPAAKVWVTAHDERVRRTHRDADGQTIPANLRYVLDKPKTGPTVAGQAKQATNRTGGQTDANWAAKVGQAGTELAREPRDPGLSPGNRANCRCVSVNLPGLVAASIRTTDTRVSATQATAEVFTRFPRIAESEDAHAPDRASRFMARALAEVAARAKAARRAPRT